jgi:hypothetical protein
VNATGVTLVDQKGTVHALKAGMNILGRDWLSVPDKRLSRNQAEVTVDGALVTIKRLGVNPVKMKAGAEHRVLQKNVVYSLQHGDTFTLLADEFPFTVQLLRPSLASSPVVGSSSSTAATAAKYAATDADRDSIARAVQSALLRPLEPINPVPGAPFAATTPATATAAALSTTTASSVAAAAAAATTTTTTTTTAGKRTRSPPPGAPTVSGAKRPAGTESTSVPAVPVAADAAPGEAPHGVKRTAAVVSAAANASSESSAETPATAPAKKALPSTSPSAGGGEKNKVDALTVSADAVPLKRTRLDGAASDPRARGARTIALPLLCTSRKGVRANLPPSNAVSALAAAARPFLRRHIDDRECKLVIVAVSDSDALRALDALDEPLGEPWQQQILRVADQAAVARALVHLASEHATPARFLCNEATWRLHAGGAPINRAIFDAVGDDFEALVRQQHMTPAKIGGVYPVGVPVVSPLRRNEAVQCVLHAVVPVVDPDDSDCMSIELASGVLRQLYDALFQQFERAVVRDSTEQEDVLVKKEQLKAAVMATTSKKITQPGVADPK